MAIPSVALQGIESPIPNAHLNQQVVINAVLKYYMLEWKDIDRPTRKSSLVRPRQVIMYLLRIHTKMTLRDIGEIFQRKYDHTTVLHSCKLVRDMIEVGELNADIIRITNMLDA